MNKTASIALFVLVLAPISAFADSQTHSITDMWNVKVAHIGDMITITNNDTVTHSITGADNIGEKVDWTLAPGQNTTLSFSSPVQFSFYDKYHEGLFGSIYTYEPSINLTSIDVYNHTSVSDLYSKPAYVLLPPNVITVPDEDNQTINTPVFGESNSTNPVNDTIQQNTTVTDKLNTPDDSQTVANLQAVIKQLQSELIDQDNQTNYWHQNAEYWQSVAMKFIVP